MTKVKKFSFQATFVFLLLLTLPIDPGYYGNLFASANGSGFQDIFRLLDYVPFLGYAGQWGLHSFLGWGFALGAALIVATVWFVLDQNFEKNYERWNYWLRLILRYRLAVALFTYGFLLFFPLQAPFPSLSDLHTKYGEFLPWKIYYHSLGVSEAGYEPILGFAEILAGALLLWRRTVVIGAGLAAAILINIVLVNFAYDLGAHVLSVYLLLIASVLLVHDVPRLYALLIRERAAAADHYLPYFSGRIALLRKWGTIVFPLFIVLYGFLAYGSYRSDRWPYPASKGIAGAEGYYDVSHFALNGTELPYSFTDTIRWQNVVFEKWNTISVRINKPLTPDLNGPFIHTVRDYESEGNGGRIFYTYTFKDGSLELVNQQDSLDVYHLAIKQSDGNILLYGKDHYGRDLHVGLNRLDKKYLLHLGRRKPVKVY
jgi:hypothetical protein